MASFIKVQLKKVEPLADFFYQSRDQWLDKDLISFIPIATTEVQNDFLDFLPESVFILNSSYGSLLSKYISFFSLLFAAVWPYNEFSLLFAAVCPYNEFSSTRLKQ